MPNDAPVVSDDRTPKNRLPLNDDMLRKCVYQICKYDDSAVVNALLILFDEVEASQFDRLRIDSMCIVIKEAAFTKSAQCSQAQDAHMILLRHHAETSDEVLV